MNKVNTVALGKKLADVYISSGWIGVQRSLAVILAPLAFTYREKASAACDKELAARDYKESTIEKLASERKLLLDCADSFIVVIDAWPMARSAWITTGGKTRKLPEHAKARDMVLTVARAHRKKFGKDEVIGLISKAEARKALIEAITTKAKAKPKRGASKGETCSIVELHDALAAFMADDKHPASTKALRDMAKQLFDRLPVETIEA